MKKDLSSKHFIFLILASTLISLRTYCSLFIKYGKQDTWIYLLISLLIMILFFYFIINSSIKMQNFNIIYLSSSYMPKFLSNFFIFLFAIGLFLTSVESASTESNFVYTSFFLEAPVWCCILLFLIPTFYVLTRKFSSILIFVVISFSFLLANDLILGILVEPYKNYSYILPILHDALTLDTLKCIILLIGCLSSISITIPYLMLLNNKDNLKKHALTGTIICSIILLFSIIGVIASLGVERASNIFYSGFIQSQRVKTLEFVEFGQLFYIFRIVISFFIKYILCSYGIYLLYRNNIKNKKIYFSLFTIVVFIISYIISNNNYILFNSLRYFQVISVILLLIVPLLGYIIMYTQYKKIRRKN